MKNPLATVSEDIQKARKTICDNCEHKQKKLDLVETCGVCGCILTAKLKFAAQTCPINKWSIININ